MCILIIRDRKWRIAVRTTVHQQTTSHERGVGFIFVVFFFGGRGGSMVDRRGYQAQFWDVYER